MIKVGVHESSKESGKTQTEQRLEPILQMASSGYWRVCCCISLHLELATMCKAHAILLINGARQAKTNVHIVRKLVHKFLSVLQKDYKQISPWKRTQMWFFLECLQTKGFKRMRFTNLHVTNINSRHKLFPFFKKGTWMKNCSQQWTLLWVIVKIVSWFFVFVRIGSQTERNGSQLKKWNQTGHLFMNRFWNGLALHCGRLLQFADLDPSQIKKGQSR